MRLAQCYEVRANQSSIRIHLVPGSYQLQIERLHPDTLDTGSTVQAALSSWNKENAAEYDSVTIPYGHSSRPSSNLRRFMTPNPLEKVLTWPTLLARIDSLLSITDPINRVNLMDSMMQEATTPQIHQITLAIQLTYQQIHLFLFRNVCLEIFSIYTVQLGGSFVKYC